MLDIDESSVDVDDKSADKEADANFDEDATEYQIEQANSQEFRDDEQLKDPWENNNSANTAKTTNTSPDPDFNMLENLGGSADNLNDHLIWQLSMSSLTPRDFLIAETIIDSVSEDGYLSDSIENIYAGLQSQLEELEEDEVQAVLNYVQHLDPIGVAAKDTADCLLLQLKQFPEDTDGIEIATEIVTNHLTLLANHDYARLRKLTKVSDQALLTAEQLIQSLNPRPGSYFSTSRIEYVVPDVYVSKHKGRWRVSLNPELTPKVSINDDYASLIKRADKSEQNTFLKDNLQEAKWFLKSLDSRNDTILKVANCIVEHQHAFLDYGDEAMKPLVLRDIAEQIEMHESTISRVTNMKYMHTPKGIFEFKHFFSSHVSTQDGGECSAIAIRAVIKKLIAEEDTSKPLSDSKIATIIADQGINVARRTVAKYRENLSIPPSNERKRLG